MPEFYPEHDSAGKSEFMRGYLGCAEWLLDDESPQEEGGIDRAKIRGWSRAAIKSARADCADFVKANAADLELYYELTDRDESSAGNDFWLTRNRHGAGFWDRGIDPVFKRLTKAAHAYGERNVFCQRGWLGIEG